MPNIKHVFSVAKLAVFMFSTSTQVKGTEVPQVVEGEITRHLNFESNHISARTIDVWLPPKLAPGTRLPVLYMHDGQMLFDPSTTWNGQAWNIDDAASKLIHEGKVQPFIIVGIWNGGPTLRHLEYFPQKAFDSLSSDERDSILNTTRKEQSKPVFADTPKSDNYLRFIVEELKPFIDSHYPTNPHRSSTFLAGSSMGGLISLYALCEYPHIFGGAACLSTHWPGIFHNDNNPIPAKIFDYLDKNLPPPENTKIYFDLGDQTLDTLYETHQLEVDQILKRHGYNTSNWISKRFPGTDHSENAWSARLNFPLTFLLGK